MSFHASASKAVDTLFGKFGQPARLVFRDSSEVDALVIHRFPDQIIDVMDTRVHAATDLFELRIADVGPLSAVYQIVVDGKIYVAHGEPVRDQHGLVMKIEAYAS
jgi:hypothetical protein